MKSDKPSPKKNAAKSAKAEPAAPSPAPKAAATPAAKPPEIPSILLEGDQPSQPQPAGPGQRYALGAVPPAPHNGPIETAVELPEAYGTGKLLLTARDPHWLYARWDLTQEQQRKYNALSVDRHLLLRLFMNEIKGQPVDQIHVHPESRHWFVHVAQAGTKYLAELGYYNANAQWHVISTSSPTLTPPDDLSDDTSAEFATIPTNISFAKLMAMARIAVLDKIPMTEVMQQLRASGYEFPEAESPSAPVEWTAERETALASIITMDRVRRVWMGSLEITELIRRQLHEEISSMGAAEFSAPSSHLGGFSSIGSLSSPFGGQERRKGFWFIVNAELIIYGATEPDAEVTIGGRPIKLRQDGTFSYHFILPDGQHELPAVAVSADKTDRRAAELKFSRGTKFHGDVGAHPQNPALKHPHPDNVS